MADSEKESATGKGRGGAAVVAIAALAGCVVFFGVYSDEFAAIVGGGGWFFSEVGDGFAAHAGEISSEGPLTAAALLLGGAFGACCVACARLGFLAFCASATNAGRALLAAIVGAFAGALAVAAKLTSIRRAGCRSA